jgi:Domain of unknown function (DUF4157)
MTHLTAQRVDASSVNSPTWTASPRQVQRCADLPGSPSGASCPCHAPEIVEDVLRTDGEPLPAPVGKELGSALGFDFSAVRIHRDGAAAESAVKVGARAYTVGNHVVFGPHRFAPERPEGRVLLAHELVHTMQQRAMGNAATAAPLRIGDDASGHETQADRVAAAVAHGHGASLHRPTQSLLGPIIQRQSLAGADPAAMTGQSAAMYAQLDPKKIYCALHAAVCLGLSENPPAAALCWANFAQRCAGAMAEGGRGGNAVEVASGSSTPTPSAEEA